jgi:hypothetical protein
MNLSEFDLEKSWWTNREESPQSWWVSFEEIVDRNYNLDFKNPNSPADLHSTPESLFLEHGEMSETITALRLKLKDSLLISIGENNPLFNHLSENMDFFTHSSSELEILKSLIIDFGITGKLVRDTSKLGNGSEVVQESIKRSQIKQKTRSEVSPYCEVPSHWDWATTEELCFTQTGSTPKRSTKTDSDSVAYITSADIESFIASSQVRVSRSNQDRGLRLAPAGSILFVGIGNVGKCGVTREESTFNQQIHAATPYYSSAKYICYIYASSFFKSQCKNLSSATTLTILNKSKWSGIPLPVAPIKEQDMIVEQIDYLLNLCDQLDVAVKKSAKTIEDYARSVASITSIL